MHLAKHCLLLISICGLLNTSVSAQSATLWTDQADTAARGLESKSFSNERGVRNARSLSLNSEAMKSILAPAIEDLTASNNIQARAAKLISIELPLPDGSNVELSLKSIDILPP